MKKTITPKQRDALESIQWGEKHFGSLTTNRQVRRNRVAGLVKMGLVESAGMVYLCDDDGFTIQPERYREGFRLTEQGRAIIAEVTNV